MGGIAFQTAFKTKKCSKITFRTSIGINGKRMRKNGNIKPEDDVLHIILSIEKGEINAKMLVAEPGIPSFV